MLAVENRREHRQDIAECHRQGRRTTAMDRTYDQRRMTHRPRYTDRDKDPAAMDELCATVHDYSAVAVAADSAAPAGRSAAMGRWVVRNRRKVDPDMHPGYSIDESATLDYSSSESSMPNRPTLGCRNRPNRLDWRVVYGCSRLRASLLQRSPGARLRLAEHSTFEPGQPLQSLFSSSRTRRYRSRLLADTGFCRERSCG